MGRHGRLGTGGLVTATLSAGSHTITASVTDGTKLTGVATISVSGPTTVCTSSTGGTAAVTDDGGGLRTHQWGYRTMSLGSTSPIGGQTGASYLIGGADFGMPPGTPGMPGTPGTFGQNGPG